MRLALAAALLAALSTAALAADDDKKSAKSKMKFWNLSGHDLIEVSLAPAGTDKFGDNQCKNDDNNAIENDERLPITGIAAGKYDVRIKDKSGRVCIVKNIDVKEGSAYAFSIEAEQIADCK